MLVAYRRRSVTYETLIRLLEIQDFGTPFTKLQQLERLKLTVIIRRHGILTELEQFLQQRHPIIVSVDTGELPYWERRTAHAVVIVSIDREFVYLHDPDLPRGPIAVDKADFELAWLNRDEEYALICETQ
jgi:predicted double-glycine peptidase